jgi:hypothetical protein
MLIFQPVHLALLRLAAPGVAASRSRSGRKITFHVFKRFSTAGAHVLHENDLNLNALVVLSQSFFETSQMQLHPHGAPRHHAALHALSH